MTTLRELAALATLADRNAPSQARTELEEHLAKCDCCRQHLKELSQGATWDSAQQLGSDTKSSKEPLGDVTMRSTESGSISSAAPLSLATDSLGAPVVLNSVGSIEDTMILKPGQQIGKYQVIGKLGAGGFGQVYRALQLDTLREFALKILTNSGRFAGSREKLLEEAQRSCAISHPHVATAYEVVSEETLDFLVMDFIEGPTLSHQSSRVDLEIAKVVEWVKQAAYGLAAIHAGGLLHLDLKPGNLLLDVKSDTVKIIDFGLEREAERREEGRVVAEVKGGTLAYMSPEQLVNHSVDERSEVYSLGVVLYELLTGRRPFLGNKQQLRQEIVNTPPPALRLFRKSIPRELCWITLKCIEKKPDGRYQSARELAQDLERWQNHQPVVARSPSPLRRGWLFVKRKPLQTVLAIAGMVLVSVTSGWAISAHLARQEIENANEALEVVNGKLRSNNARLGRMAVERLKEEPARAADWAIVFEAFPEYQLPENLIFSAIHYARDGDLESALRLVEEAKSQRPKINFLWEKRNSEPARMDAALVDREVPNEGRLKFNIVCVYVRCAEACAAKGDENQANEFARMAFELLREPAVMKAIVEEGQAFSKQYEPNGDLAWLYDTKSSKFEEFLAELSP